MEKNSTERRTYCVELTDDQASAYLDHWTPGRGAPEGAITLDALEAELALADAIRENHTRAEGER